MKSTQAKTSMTMVFNLTFFAKPSPAFFKSRWSPSRTLMLVIPNKNATTKVINSTQATKTCVVTKGKFKDLSMTNYTFASSIILLSTRYLKYRWIQPRTQIKGGRTSPRLLQVSHSRTQPDLTWTICSPTWQQQKFEFQWVKLQLRNRRGFTWNKCTMQISTFVTNVEQGPRH